MTKQEIINKLEILLLECELNYSLDYQNAVKEAIEIIEKDE